MVERYASTLEINAFYAFVYQQIYPLGISNIFQYNQILI